MVDAKSTQDNTITRILYVSMDLQLRSSFLWKTTRRLSAYKPQYPQYPVFQPILCHKNAGLSRFHKPLQTNTLALVVMNLKDRLFAELLTGKNAWPLLLPERVRRGVLLSAINHDLNLGAQDGGESQLYSSIKAGENLLVNTVEIHLEGTSFWRGGPVREGQASATRANYSSYSLLVTVTAWNS